MAIGLSICTDVMNLDEEKRQVYLAEILPEIEHIEIQLSQFFLSRYKDDIRFIIDLIKRYQLSWTAHFPKEDRGMTSLMRKELFKKQIKFWINETFPFVKLVEHSTKKRCFGIVLHLDALRLRYRNLLPGAEMIQNLKIFSQATHQYQIPIFLENVDNFDYARLPRIINLSQWKLCRDLGHEAYDDRIMPQEFWSRIGLIHVHGFDGKHDHLPLDSLRDIKIISRLSQQISLTPNVAIILETKYFPVDKILQSIEIIRETREKCLSSISSNAKTI